MYSYGPTYGRQKQDDQLELTYSNYVRTQDVTPKTCRRRWMIGRSGERGSGISVLAARHDDDDDDIKAKINTALKICKCGLRIDRDERINFTISECCRLTENECKNRHDWVGKVINWELWKRLEFKHTDKWYKYKLEYLIETEMHKILRLWDRNRLSNSGRKVERSFN